MAKGNEAAPGRGRQAASGQGEDPATDINAAAEEQAKETEKDGGIPVVQGSQPKENEPDGASRQVASGTLRLSVGTNDDSEEEGPRYTVERPSPKARLNRDLAKESKQG